MKLSDHAVHYVKSNGLRSLMIASSCRRFERITGIDDPVRVSLTVIVAFRQAAMSMSLANDTIEKTVTDVMTIVRFVCGEIPEIGKRLPGKRPNPKPVPPDSLQLVFAAAEPWLKRWICLDYWTGARLSDSVDIFLAVSGPSDTIAHEASKTGIHHVWPVSPWLQQWMTPVESPIRRNTEYFRKVLAWHIEGACVAAGCTGITSRNFRQRSITEWTRANATAGAIVHGCGLGVLAHYLDPLSVLESAAPRVRVPACFRAGDCQTVDSEATLLAHFRRMDPAAQSLVSQTAERLSAG